MNNQKVRLRKGYLPNFKEPPHKLSFSYKREKSKFQCRSLADSTLIV